MWSFFTYISDRMDLKSIECYFSKANGAVKMMFLSRQIVIPCHSGTRRNGIVHVLDSVSACQVWKCATMCVNDNKFSPDVLVEYLVESVQSVFARFKFIVEYFQINVGNCIQFVHMWLLSISINKLKESSYREWKFYRPCEVHQQCLYNTLCESILYSRS